LRLIRGLRLRGLWLRDQVIRTICKGTGI